MAINKIEYTRVVDKKMSRLSTSIILATFAVTIAIIGLFCFGGYDAELEGPEYTEEMLNWTYVLLCVAIVAALVFPVIEFVTKPKQGIKNLLPVLGLAAIGAVCYYFSSSELLELPGYNGPDNTPETLKWSEAILYLTYVLMVLNILALVVTEIYKKIKK